MIGVGGEPETLPIRTRWLAMGVSFPQIGHGDEMLILDLVYQAVIRILPQGRRP